MKKIIVVFLVISVFCSPVINSVYAGQIQAKMMSQTESQDMKIIEVNSAVFVDSIECGGDDALAIIGGVFLVLCLIAAATTP